MPTIEAWPGPRWWRRRWCNWCGWARLTVLGDGVYGTFANDPTHSPVINHAVLLIGWDDAQGAWIIKNSWGIDWGSTAGFGNVGGYGYVQYEQNNIGYAAAWVTLKP